MLMKLVICILLSSTIILSSCKKEGTQSSEHAQSGQQTRTEQAPQDITALVFSYSGKVELNDAQIKRGDIVKYGDSITTFEDGICEIIIKKKNIFKLGKNSKLIFKISPTENNFMLEKGWFSGVSKEKFSNLETYNIVSPAVVAGVRGTSYCVKVENPNATYFCVCNGTIKLKGSGEQEGSNISSPHHIARRFTLAGNKVKIDTNPGMLYHTDRDIENLAKKINVSIDWTRTD